MRERRQKIPRAYAIRHNNYYPRRPFSNSKRIIAGAILLVGNPLRRWRRGTAACGPSEHTYVIKKGYPLPPFNFRQITIEKNIKPINTYTSRNVLSARTLFSNEMYSCRMETWVEIYAGQRDISTSLPLYYFLSPFFFLISCENKSQWF